MPQSVGAVALDIVMGKNTVASVVKNSLEEVQKVMSDSSATISAKVGAIGNACTSIGGALMPVSTAVGGVGIACAKMSMDFENAMAKVSTIADTTEVPLTDLQKQILDLSNQTGISSTEIADNVYNAISAGQKTGDAVNFVSNSTKLAKAGFADAGASLDVLTTIMNSYGLEASEVTNVSDMLIQTQNKGKTTVAELSSTMGKVIPTANAYGVGLDNICNGYAIMTANGIATAESTTYMNSMLNELGKSGTDVSDILQNETGQSFKELMDGGASLGDVLGILQGYCDETGTQFSDLWSSAEAGKAALVMAKDGADGFNSSLTEMQNCTGATDSAFEKMETKSYTLEKSVNSIKNSGIELGDTLMQTLGPMIDNVCTKVSQFTDWFNTLDDKQKNAIVKIGLVVAATGPAIVAFGKVSKGVSGVIGLFGSFGKAGGKLAGTTGQVASSATSAAGGVGKLSQNALGLVAAGAGILLAATGLALLAYASIQLAQAGPAACIAMVSMVAVLALLAVGAAALAPALTAGAVGLVAFGAGLALVGVGILAACAGMTLLATQLPTIAQYGLAASVAILAISGATVTLTGALLVLSPAIAVVAGATGLLTLGNIALSASILGVTGVAALSIITLGLFTVSLVAVGVAVGVVTVAVLALGVAVAVLNGNVTQSFSAMHSNVSGCVGKIKTAIVNGFSTAFNAIKNIPKKAVTWGKDMIQGIINGIKSKISAVGDAVKSVGNKIKSFLHFSVPDEGPLTDYETWMPDFMNGMADGITNNVPLIKDAVAGVSENMKVDVQTPKITGVAGTVKSEQEEKNNDLLDAIKKLIEKLDKPDDDGTPIQIILDGRLIDEYMLSANSRKVIRSGGMA